ncbi:uncharacterized protein YndB with AHSA1/START domain [Murinocardiopsis flavida]|uniref:Uncharacterized protein YndB with AHSA1/START domain n=2 Tax=Murinocardiopsis flavida TaxID=645275 RepID=A0A2P8DGF3_9ACTN|nr:uncharacterized protein YndB with AHSA1/START domain [Murinocardiopsis flavida]
MLPDRLDHEIVVAAPVHRVWAALTEGDQVARWYAFDGAEITARDGGSLVFRWAEHGDFHGRVVAVEPEAFFSYRLAAFPGAAPAPSGSTLVEFTLLPKGSGVRLRVEESGIRDLDMPEKEQAEYAAAAAQGWENGLHLLRAHVEAECD